jgi:hypothetical protein
MLPAVRLLLSPTPPWPRSTKSVFQPSVFSDYLGVCSDGREYGPVRAEIIGFFDAGVAWDKGSRPSGIGDGTRSGARSVGAGLRVNALGYLIVELDVVRPLDRPIDKWRFVFAVRPGF